jgi:hypothetical protein
MFLKQVALPDQNNSVSISNSKTIGLTFFNSNSLEQSISNTSDYFYFGITRYNQIPLFKQLIINNTNILKNLLALNGFIIPSKNVSIHYQIKPNNYSVGYFVALKFGYNPYLNKTNKIFDIFQIFCPTSKINH